MSNTVLHKAHSRGEADHGWLHSWHSFSFSDYYDPHREHFGALRVLNDDEVAPGMGFGQHPHRNMEIISIPLEGDLEHKDSMGNVAVIKHGDIQVMSAGTGITHSEYNKNQDKPVRFLQIWVFPNKNNVEPRYDQITLHAPDRHNRLQQIVSPYPGEQGVWIYQDAWFYIGRLDKDVTLEYPLNRTNNGVYIFILQGEITIDGQTLEHRDGIGIWNTDKIIIQSNTPDTEILLMEVPMIRLR
jgi:redox-sensitive bicupin YhaK (pirin superfamily)